MSSPILKLIANKKLDKRCQYDKVGSLITEGQQMVNQLAGGFGAIISSFVIADRDEAGNITFRFLNCEPNPDNHDRMVELFTNLFELFNQKLSPESIQLNPEDCGGLTLVKRRM